MQSVDEQIKKAKADLAITQSQDAVTLLKTRYNVRRAELDVQRNPIIAEIDGKKNVLTLEQQKRALQQLETDIAARQEQADSQLAVFQEQRNRSLIDVQRELQRIALCKTLAPITGLVAIKQNRAGNFNFGQQMPDIREGDTLQPGMPVADILDLSEVEVWAKVGELDRANLREGQDATLQLDAIPDKRFGGKIKAMSGTATSDVFSGDPSKKFDVIFSVDMRQLLAGVGMKPADIERIMATAEANAKKGINAGVNPFAPPPAETARRRCGRRTRTARRWRRRWWTTQPGWRRGRRCGSRGSRHGRRRCAGSRSGRRRFTGPWTGTRRFCQPLRRRPQEDDRSAPEDAGRHSGRTRKAAERDVGPDGQSRHHPRPGPWTGTRRWTGRCARRTAGRRLGGSAAEARAAAVPAASAVSRIRSRRCCAAAPTSTATPTKTGRTPSCRCLRSRIPRCRYCFAPACWPTSKFRSKSCPT